MKTPKYAAPKPIEIPDRRWPEQVIDKSPIWCSVDLRDGNQALPNPLSPSQKLEYFNLLTKIGIKHIEVSFPSASQDDFDFTRGLIEQKNIPDDVFIMVLSQCREHLIDRTMESIAGVERGIVHLYCAASPLHMDHVFGMDHESTIEMVKHSVSQVRDKVAAMSGSDIRLEFSPEEYTDTDMDFSLELCEAVFETWGSASADKPIIFNLPATVERRPPNQYADMIELFCRKFSARDKILVSLHCHNDQGMAVAATEMALLAGADRVEGTLFGHGERTGNMDMVTIANNLYSRGIDTGLDFSNLSEIADTVHRLTGMDIYYRQPYAGQYAFTAFSGSHQDAIRKGMQKLDQAGEKFGSGWKVPYLHVDPSDLGKEYQDLIRINSQSGKGGVAWVLEQDYSLEPPKAMHPQIAAAVQELSETTGGEITSQEVYRIFTDRFVNPAGPYELTGYWPRPDENDPTQIHGEIRIKVNGKEESVSADGNGPISAFVHGMHKLTDEKFDVADYHEQAVGKGEDARAIAYVPLKFAEGQIVFGVGSDTNIDQAAVKAIVAGLNIRRSMNAEISG